ncbi:MAG: 2-amino-4-hydroxy-6-hydroxymethyldihydropteridine pyrophosphokinase [Pelotomaculum sp. PtaU1.Bin035]|nr:MAG: 2-amino-4-hydroxy-6-hydroxymethyldihydropteridine pyrophosphokinase [Pelotomaculum sp. PtaU1.Bin035]
MNSLAPVVAYIGIGSNMGDKGLNIRKALELLDSFPGLRIKRVAPCYNTAPVGHTGQDWFVNTVAEVETELSPLELLDILLHVEGRSGRVRGVRWGPRIIDLDLLLFGMEEVNLPELVVPHPRMHERAFVMAPLADLAPGLEIPGRGRAAELAASLAKEQLIEPLPPNSQRSISIFLPRMRIINDKSPGEQNGF